MKSKKITKEIDNEKTIAIRTTMNLTAIVFFIISLLSVDFSHYYFTSESDSKNQKGENTKTKAVQSEPPCSIRNHPNTACLL